MDEEISIINSKTRNEKIKDFFIEKRKLLFSIIIIFILILVSFYSFQINKNKEIKIISTKYNNAIIRYNNGDKFQVTNEMKEIVDLKNPTYSPLAIYFLIDNNLIEIIRKRTRLIDIVIKNKKFKKDIVDKKRISVILKNISKKSKLKNIDPMITRKIWKSMINAFIAYEYKNIKKK